MALAGSLRDYLIITNNPMVKARMEGRGPFTLNFMPEASCRDVLIKVRDLVYAGHRLYTHPLSGSVKPNETPYKSVIVSVKQQGFDMEQGEIIADSVAVFDKFPPLKRKYSESVLEDFQLIDYSLLSSAIDFDG